MAQNVCGDCENESLTNDAKCETCGDRCIRCRKWDYKKKKFKQKLCDGCGQRQLIFQGDNTKQLFWGMAV